MWYRNLFFRRSAAILLVLLIAYLIDILSPMLSVIASLILKILYPFIFSLILYYLFRRLVRKFRTRMPVTVAIGLTYLIAAMILALLAVYIYPVIAKDITWIVSLDVNKIIKLDTYSSNLRIFNYDFRLSPQLSDDVVKLLAQLNAGLLSGSVAVVSSITSLLFEIIVIPFILFYLLRDDGKIHGAVMSFVPASRREAVEAFFAEADVDLYNFINGRVVVAVLTAEVLLICFFIIGVDHAVFLALVSLIFYTIPTFGAFIAAIPCLLVGFSMSASMGFYVLIIVTFCAGLEGAIITPRVMGERLYMHPLTVLLVILVAGVAFGVFGLLFATPAYALLRAVIDHRRGLFY